MPRQRRAKLTDEQMAFIVQRFARHDTAEEVAEALEAFGLVITARQVRRYDPSMDGTRIARKWRELFAKTRKAFYAHPEFFVPMANRTVRIERLAKMARQCLIRDYVFVADVLNQICDELDGVYTGNVMGDDRRFRADDVKWMTPEELDAELDTLRERARGCDVPAGCRPS